MSLFSELFTSVNKDPYCHKVEKVVFENQCEPYKEKTCWTQNEVYFPKIMNRRKWHFHKENLRPGDIVNFKLTESKMASDWRLSKVETVKIGEDVCVRQAKVAYEVTSQDDSDDWLHRTVDRPVHNICKLFHADDTSLLENIESVFRFSKQILDDHNVSSAPSVPVWDSSPPSVPVQDPSTPSVPDPLPSVPVPDSTPKDDKKQKKRKRELDRLKIDMKGWNFSSTSDSDYLKDSIHSFSKIHDEFKLKSSDDEETFSDIEDELTNDESLDIFML